MCVFVFSFDDDVFAETLWTCQTNCLLLLLSVCVGVCRFIPRFAHTMPHPTDWQAAAK